MRNTYFDKTFILEGDKVVGLCLGYDHCAEHEWGLKGLKSLLGFIQKDFPMGVEDRVIPALSEQSKKAVFFGTYSDRIAARPDSGKKTEKVVCARLVVSENLMQCDLNADSIKAMEKAIAENTAAWWVRGVYELVKKPALPYDLRHPTVRHPIQYSVLDALTCPQEDTRSVRPDPFIAAAWDADGFSVSVWGQARVNMLKALYEALLAGRCTLSLSGSANPFAGRGLCLTDVSMISDEVKANVLKTDQDYKNLMDEVAATGIVQELKAHKKTYFALSPRRDSEGKLCFFLNPMAQESNNHGWFSVEDLKAWCRDEGPIPKASQKTAVAR